MNQTEFQRTIKPSSQNGRILAALRERAGQWVPMPDLWRASKAMAVHSRVADLRKAGHIIAQQSTRAPDGTCHSCYKLLS